MIEIFLDGASFDLFSITPEIVLYQDPYLLAIDKPAGVETQPTPARYKGTIYEALLRYLQSPHSRHRSPEIGMVQRLDRDTSGVMVFSTHVKAHRSMTDVFSGRHAAKFYQAIVQGTPLADEGEIRSLLARQRKSNLMHSVERGGKEAITRYRVLTRMATASLLEVQILTGRSHQIRVHLAEAGYPILGDVKYGPPSVPEGYSPVRLMLHAARLVFPHPLTGAMLELQSGLPAEMLDCLQRLKTVAP